MIELAQSRQPQAFRALLDVYRAEGRTMWFRVQGRSMMPLIRADDALLIDLGAVPDGPGDVVLFRLGDILIAHRVVEQRRVDGTTYIVAKGDAQAYSDPMIRLEDVIGVVRVFKRGANPQWVMSGCSGRQARVIAHVSRWGGRIAARIGRFAGRLPAGAQPPAMRLISFVARATAYVLWAPLQWMAYILLTTILGERE